MADDHDRTQLIPTMACEIYKNMRASEAENRPSIDYLESVQHGTIDVIMRATIIEWLLEVAEYYNLVPETMFLAVNYFDRYLSGNAMDIDSLELVGLSCLMIACKYEDLGQEMRYTAFANYAKEELLRMEYSVLDYLEFELSVLTTKSFMGIFFQAEIGDNNVDAFSKISKIKSLSDYIAELSLLDYAMLRYDPSLLAASVMFLAKFILCPCGRPWNYALEVITLYQPCDLQECVNKLHTLHCNTQIASELSAIRDKYSKLTYESVAETSCPQSIPPKFFKNSSCDPSKCTTSAFLELFRSLNKEWKAPHEYEFRERVRCTLSLIDTK